MPVLKSIGLRSPNPYWMVRSNHITREQAAILDLLGLPERDPTDWLPRGALAVIVEEQGPMIVITDGNWPPTEREEPTLQPNFRIAPCPS